MSPTHKMVPVCPAVTPMPGHVDLKSRRNCAEQQDLHQEHGTLEKRLVAPAACTS